MALFPFEKVTCKRPHPQLTSHWCEPLFCSASTTRLPRATWNRSSNSQRLHTLCGHLEIWIFCSSVWQGVLAPPVWTSTSTRTSSWLWCQQVAAWAHFLVMQSLLLTNYFLVTGSYKNIPSGKRVKPVTNAARSITWISDSSFSFIISGKTVKNTGVSSNKNGAAEAIRVLFLFDFPSHNCLLYIISLFDSSLRNSCSSGRFRSENWLLQGSEGHAFALERWHVSKTSNVKMVKCSWLYFAGHFHGACSARAVVCVLHRCFSHSFNIPMRMCNHATAEKLNKVGGLLLYGFPGAINSKTWE